jgi:hypothetical protein
MHFLSFIYILYIYIYIYISVDVFIPFNITPVSIFVRGGGGFLIPFEDKLRGGDGDGDGGGDDDDDCDCDYDYVFDDDLCECGGRC